MTTSKYGIACVLAAVVLAANAEDGTVANGEVKAIREFLSKQTFTPPPIDAWNYGRGTAIPKGSVAFGWTRDPVEQMPNVKFLGYLPLKSSKDISSSILSVGLERSNCMGDDLYPALGAVGVKKARVWVEWREVEKKRGVYDFSKTDHQIDALIANGIEPWVYICYGNPAVYYPEVEGNRADWESPYYHGEEAMTGWLAFVSAAARQYKGKVRRWEVWNELEARWYKDGQEAQKSLGVGQSAKDFTGFLRRTYPALHAIIPDAIVGVSLCSLTSAWIPALGDAGAGEFLDAWIYHGYRRTPEEGVEKAIARAKACLRFPVGKRIEFWQGESGRATGESGRFHMHTEFGQAKFVARRYFFDAAQDVALSSVFNAADVRYGYFREDKTPKLAYWTLAAMGFMLDGLVPAPDLQLDVKSWADHSVSPRVPYQAVQAFAFRRKGVPLFAWWQPEHPDIEIEPLNVRLNACLGYRDEDNLKHPIIIDPVRRKVWDVEALRWKDRPGLDLIRPVYATTYPLVLTDISIFADFVR